MTDVPQHKSLEKRGSKSFVFVSGSYLSGGPPPLTFPIKEDVGFRVDDQSEVVPINPKLTVDVDVDPCALADPEADVDE